MQLLVSIVVPSFNQGIFLEQTLLSIINQAYSNIEIIVVDNCSTDSTSMILEKYKHNISHLIVEPDEGQASAINKGFRVASGDYLTWLNSDDFYYSSSAISSIINVFDDQSISMVYGDVLMYSSGSSALLLKGSDFSTTQHINYLSVPIPQQGCTIRRDIFNSGTCLDLSLHYLLDRDFFLRIALTQKVHYLPIVIGIFRQHSSSKSSNHFSKWSREYCYLYSHYCKSGIIPVSCHGSLMCSVYAQQFLLYLRSFALILAFKSIFLSLYQCKPFHLFRFFWFKLFCKRPSTVSF